MQGSWQAPGPSSFGRRTVHRGPVLLRHARASNVQAKGRAAPPPPNSAPSAGVPSSSGTPSNQGANKGSSAPSASGTRGVRRGPVAGARRRRRRQAGRQQAVVSPSPFSYESVTANPELLAAATPELLGSLNGHVGTTQASIKEGGPSPSSNTALAAILEKASELDIPKEIVECSIKKTSEKGQATYTEKIYEIIHPDGFVQSLEKSRASTPVLYNKVKNMVGRPASKATRARKGKK
ncbi:hypothetical protein ACP70R_008397 [Stipagrostis hirtigluma subsp. patula]